jgi:hypothetical protein
MFFCFFGSSNASRNVFEKVQNFNLFWEQIKDTLKGIFILPLQVSKNDFILSFKVSRIQSGSLNQNKFPNNSGGKIQRHLNQ